MVSLLKTFAKGLLYVIGLPFFLLALALFGVVGLIAFVVQLIKSIIFFFTGQKFFPELPEDKQLRLLKEGPKEQAVQEEQPVMQEASVINDLPPVFRETITPQPEPVIETPKPTPSIEEVCFVEEPEDNDLEVDELEKEEPVQEKQGSILNQFIEDEEEEPLNEEPLKEEEPPVQETVLETKEEENEEELVEQLETYVPRSSNYGQSVYDDEEENDADIGVDIDYNL